MKKFLLKIKDKKFLLNYLWKTKISHIDISERKLLLRVVDISVIIISLWAAESLISF